MAENYDEKIKNMSEKAKAELYNMQSRAMPPAPSFVRPRGGGSFSGRSENEPQKNEAIPPEPTAPPEAPKKNGLLGLDILKIIDAKGFELDSDRILLIALILLLSGDGGDEILIFALAYLML